ncbi:TetR/AcrR family transcriptional regulator [Acidaminobacter sp. JC074]|uniref:TetR/AcrR family transcriptional regulator n=1 Tax=Acidaminobacter sp. JC074 TaxID=2530199 RepID=UPI001F0D32A1|nr:TetR/AcrR family transcriptional regulator [Acidaminobacter sp. JC074]MCH4887730.1 TetR/AcrR family transcriptional regulator [Acidaminobacter sp. JC074]
MTFERARSDQNKEIRLNEIKTAAIKLFYEKSFSEISMAGIAKELNFTRGNLYKYYQTKEAIYLDIILDDIKKWVFDLKERSHNNPAKSIEEFVDLWTDVTIKNKQLIQLLSIMFTILERNAPLENLISFKKSMMLESAQLIEIIQSQINLSPEDTFKFVNYHVSTSIGLYPVCHPSEVQREAAKLSGTNYEFMDFRTQFSDYLTIYLKHLTKNPSN